MKQEEISNKLIHEGYRLIQKLHAWYLAMEQKTVNAIFQKMFFLLLTPFFYLRFYFLNQTLKKCMEGTCMLTSDNYSSLKKRLCILDDYIKYFHTFFNASTERISWFMRPLFPLIKRHIHLQADYRNLLQQEIRKINNGRAGTFFQPLTEAELWECRNKAYPYLI